MTDYREKPSLAYDVSMGIYVYEASGARPPPPRGSVHGSPSWCCGSWGPASRWRCTRSQADWYDIGTLTEYERAVQDVQDRPDAFGLGQPVSAGERAAS